jgi:hypothetical protein
MGVFHVGVVLLAVVANAFSAVADFLRLERIRVSMERVGVPTRILPLLGVSKAAAVVGLLVGVVVPWVGVAAAGGLVLFFVLAVAAHLRGRDRMIGLPVGFLALAVAVLVTAAG